MALSDAVQTLQGFQGLQINQANMANAEAQRLQKEQQAKSMQLGSDYLRKYQQSVQEGKPDYNSLNEAILVVPELADNVLKGIGIQDKAQKQMAAADVAELIPLVGNKAAFMQKLGTRANSILERGGNPQDTIALAKIMEEEGPEAVMMQLRSVGNALKAQGFEVGLPETEKKTPFQQGSGDMAGFVFDPNTGSYTINEQARKAYTDAQAKKDAGEPLGVKDKISLNKDISAITKDATMIHRTAQDIDKLKTISSGPASIAIVYKFMKSLDPTSVVREGEFATAENAAGIPDTVANIYNKLINGERLPESVIADFSVAAKELANTAVDAAGTEVDDYLNTFGDDLGEKFATGLRGRVPKRFEIQSKPKAQAGAAPQDAQVIDWSSM
jgi:hypothetical protein